MLYNDDGTIGDEASIDEGEIVTGNDDDEDCITKLLENDKDVVDEDEENKMDTK
jgi:hypothetical protein